MMHFICFARTGIKASASSYGDGGLLWLLGEWKDVKSLEANMTPGQNS